MRGVAFSPKHGWWLGAAALLALAGCAATMEEPSASGGADAGPAMVDGQRMRQLDAPANVGDWMSTGRGWDEKHYSPLDQINDSNVGRLGLAWYDDLDTFRGVQATPLVVDGVLYNESIYNVVTAYDAKTGRKLWTHDPQVGTEWARLACCGPSSRGIAAWKGKLYIGALDGRLIALDAKTGQEVWTTRTFDAEKAPYSITGAPRVYDGKVVIGNGGADYGSRGFVAAFDAETGEKVWKFYIVPTDPAKGPDGEASDSAMKIARPTWHGKFWEAGGGGNAWDSFAYDPDLNLVYIGTGNGSPHMWHFRSEGKGDNLFLCSIVAVDADSGEYKWHYQMVPEEDWDYTCTQPMILADLELGGKQRPVIMQAPKNGFFYVIDRATGELLSAESYVSVNTWASHIDMKTGRPVLRPGAHNTTTPHLMSPSWLAAHTWHPMAYSPDTGLVYLGAQEQGAIYARAADGEYQYRPGPGRTNSGQAYGNHPELRAKLQKQANETEKGYLLAWDPKTQKEAWRVPYPHPGSGGVLATGGNLLVQGTINKTVAIYRADNGEKLWEMDVDQAAIAGPITYMVDGEQYIALNAGWGGSPVYNLGPFQTSTAKLLVFKLDASGVTLPPPPEPTALPRPPRLMAGEQQVALGRRLYGETCHKCHGDNAVGGVKDLRFMAPETHEAFLDIVLNGTLADKGMAGFADILSKEQAEAIHAYLIARGNEDWQDAAVSAQ
ncbi:Quinohemoprotein alcohol dehydrogenase ADH-IIG precursor [Croceibacterium atlanticum]|uniref:Quinohemoprotein alcohol dehydrogenase ADH-IIG n=1 Tax=Croceibacterium atlanticum TaxID=1267766 RepID=A0A0F7KY20_9SPHN|nr:PQQ-dependent dehydrogenase, methanol/ethanol family [Croceibacterium atlanticum]AKH44141.1 Quinohemoprotein alcohol dehydrogenase ADH-IIG precursor [Croceibacterium atlanticum]